MSVPNFGDIAKSANDLLNKDFYHLSATTFELKSNTPNNVAFKVTGKTSHEKTTAGAIEGKYSDKATGTATTAHRLDRLHLSLGQINGVFHGIPVHFAAGWTPGRAYLLTFYRRAGLTLTQTWNTAAALDTKVELADSLAKGLKAEGVFSFLPSAGEKAASKKGAKFNLTFKQSNFHSRAFFDLLKGPTANIDAVVGHEGFLAGASAGYDVQKASVTGYAAAVGYQAPPTALPSPPATTSASSLLLTTTSQVEAGAKATWNSKAGNNVGLEVASKYRIDPVSFAKFKVNNNGVAALGYNVLLREGVTLGLGASFDTQKLDQATHKLGASFTFEG
ncbi:LOW QUALITY PROTEIN: putative mitochondrial outer membrane protein porin [Colletotrichum tofieldiae]|nr:LOW QUALITY PROTEIN: putative mitochondrial outer membrane protein porin [Colletotrichum tofieldiae]